MRINTVRNTAKDCLWWLGAVATAGVSGAAWGAFIGWGIGCGISSFSDPCNKEPNDRAVLKCSWTSPKANIGAALGAGAGFFVGAATAIYYTPVNEDAAKKTMILATLGPCVTICGGSC